jgi:hypothetical protein
MKINFGLYNSFQANSHGLAFLTVFSCGDKIRVLGYALGRQCAVHASKKIA